MKKNSIILGATILVVVVLLVVVGRGFFDAKNLRPSAEKFVAVFYALYNDQEISNIYRNISYKDFRDTNDFPEFERFMKGTYNKLGKVVKIAKGPWQINITLRGLMCVISYSTQRERGESVDTFTLIRKNGVWLLNGYRIISEDLFS